MTPPKPQYRKCDTTIYFEHTDNKAVFEKVRALLWRRGFKLQIEPRIKKQYPSLAKTKNYYHAQKGDLEVKLECHPRQSEVTFYQNVVIENPNGGQYDFNKLSRMPYLIRLRYLVERFHIINLLASLGFEDISEPTFDTLEGKIFHDINTSGHWHGEPLLEWGLKQPDYNRKDANGKPVVPGETKYFYEYETKRLVRGVVYYDLNSMWYAVSGKRIRTVCCRELLDHDELIIDNFAGGGGASTGIELALGRHVDHAINHNGQALGMHRINHSQTVHHCEDVFDIDPLKLTGGRRVGLGWFSPDCKHFSKAKGGKPLDKKIRGLALVMLRWAAIGTRVIKMENVEEIQTWGPLYDDHDCGCRGGAKQECTSKNCHYGRPIPEHKGRTWKALLAALSTGVPPNHPDLPEMIEVLDGTVSRDQLLRGFGYTYEVRELRACDYGAPTIRKRLFMIARCDGRPIVWPTQTHYAPKDLKGRRKPWRTVAECLDWHLPCPSIFLTTKQAKSVKCKRPLAKATLQRIAAGIDRYVLRTATPFLVSLTHQGGDRIEPVNEPARTITSAKRGEKALVDTKLAAFIGDANRPQEYRTAPVDEPMRTQCAQIKGGHFSLVTGKLVRSGFIQGAGGPARSGEPRPVDRPMHTLLADNNSYLAAVNMIKLRGDPDSHAPGHPVTEPGHTISAGGQHHGISACYLAQHNTGMVGHDARTPLSTISSKGAQQQVVSATLTAYYGSEADGQPVTEPLRTATVKPRFGLATTKAVTDLTEEQVTGARRVAEFLRAHGVKFEGEFATVLGFVIVDIGMRMLIARELFRAQGFPDKYVIDTAWLINPRTGALQEVKLTKEAQIRMCGNSVCPPIAAAIIAANVPELAIWREGPRRRLNGDMIAA
jgi:DNA (cytosine-5)-methyltransferase 1